MVGRPKHLGTCMQTPFVFEVYTLVLQVREFEPSETAMSDDEDYSMGKPRSCCSVM